MLRESHPFYTVSLDKKYAQDGEVLGIDLVSNVETPAVKIRGLCFKAQTIAKREVFKDNVKYRIVAPVLVPGDVYREDNEDGNTEKYFIQFTEDTIEELAKDFMSKLSYKAGKIFNDDHKEDVLTDSYILEAILVDGDAKVKMIKDAYGLDVPRGSFVLVQQFNNKEQYQDIVDNNRTSFSLEGFLGLVLSDNSKKTKLSMKKRKFVGVKRTLKSASKKKLEDVVETEDLIIVADELVEGAAVAVIEDVTKGAEDSFSGEVDTMVDGKTVTIIIEDNKIVEIVKEDEAEAPETEMAAEDPKKEEDKKEEMEDPTTEVPTQTPEDVNAKFDALYEQIAALKNDILKLQNPEMDKDDPTEVDSKLKFTSALNAFNEWSKKR